VHDRNESPGNQLLVVILFILFLMKRLHSICAAKCLSRGNKTKAKHAILAQSNLRYRSGKLLSSPVPRTSSRSSLRIHCGFAPNISTQKQTFLLVSPYRASLVILTLRGMIPVHNNIRLVFV